MIHIIQYYVQSYLTMKMFSSVKYPIMNYDKWIVHIHDIDVEVTRIKMHALGMHESISGARGFRNARIESWMLPSGRAQRTIVLQVGVELFREIAGRFVERMGCGSGGGWTACINYAKHPYALIINHSRGTAPTENSVGDVIAYGTI